MRDENQRLTEQLRASNEQAQSNLSELTLLRAQTGTVLQLKQENAELKAKEDRAATQSPQAQTDSFDIMYGTGAHLRVRSGMRWGLALLEYASNHQGQFPSSFQEAVPFLGKDNESQQAASKADQYEMLYQGKLDGMTNPPPEGAIIVREKQPWRTPDGAWARTYIYGNGVGTIQTDPDGDFEKWEGPRIPKSSAE